MSVPLRAAIMMAFCCAFIALSTFLAKILGRGVAGAPMHTFQIVLGRYGFALIALIPVVLATRARLSGAPLPLYVARAGFGWAGGAALFAAAAMIPLADATAISFLNPVFSMALAALFLGERVAPLRWRAAAVALVGGVLVIRPTGAVEPGALIALAAAVFMSTELLLAKMQARTETVLRTIFLTNVIGFVIALAVAVFFWRPPNAAELALMAGVGLSMVSAQVFLMASLRIADSSFVTPFLYGALFFAALYDALWFGVLPAPLSVAGAALIVFGAAMLALREGRGAGRPQSG